jgi:hypothetical protein
MNKLIKEPKKQDKPDWVFSLTQKQQGTKGENKKRVEMQNYGAKEPLPSLG